MENIRFYLAIREEDDYIIDLVNRLNDLLKDNNNIQFNVTDKLDTSLIHNNEKRLSIRLPIKDIDIKDNTISITTTKRDFINYKSKMICLLLQSNNINISINKDTYRYIIDKEGYELHYDYHLLYKD